MSHQIKHQNQLSSETIEYLRFPLAIGVVFIHCLGGPLVVNDGGAFLSSLPQIDIYDYIRICFTQVLPHIAVPVFFLISGYLFFLKMDTFTLPFYKKQMKNRFKTLVIPYFLWNTLYLLFIIGLKLLAHFLKGKPLSGIITFLDENRWFHVYWDCSVWGSERVNLLGFPNPMSGPILLPLWFLRDLIVVSLFTPVIYWFIKKTKWYGLLLLGAAYITSMWPVIPGMTILSFFFFSLGAYYSLNKIDLASGVSRFRAVSYFAAPILLLLAVLYGGRNTVTGEYIFPFYILAGVFFAINLAARIVTKSNPKSWLANSSFFIFASHFFVLPYVSEFVQRLFPSETLLCMTVKYFSVPLLIVIICVSAYYVLKRITPGLLNLLTGSRN